MFFVLLTFEGQNTDGQLTVYAPINLSYQERYAPEYR